MTAFDHEAPVLVTGGCGFVGCNLVDALAARGNKVAVLDNFARSGARENAHWLKLRHGERVSISAGDVRDSITVIALVRQAGAVLHLAGQVAVTGSLQDPVEDFEINARGTLNVLEAIRLHRPEAPLIFASTNKVYGQLLTQSEVFPTGLRYAPTVSGMAGGVDDQRPLDFYSPYGCSKGAADQYVRDYARVYGLRTAVMRMSCIYGPRQFGNEDQGWIAHFMTQALRNQPIKIYGDGLQVRDALHVEDAAAAWLALLDNIEAQRGRVFNLGGGPANATSLLELIEAISRLLQRLPSFTFGDWRPGDQFWYVTDLAPICRALGWAPRIPLHDGLRSLRAWLETRLGRDAINEVRA